MKGEVNMAIVINREIVKDVLSQAFAEAQENNYKLSSEFANEINQVLSGNHLTFKYIMMTALLSKASFPRINPLCLQKGSSLKGSYDARSICHNVLVPFEREKLSNALGGSNEPFLNKPARFKELDVSNPA